MNEHPDDRYVDPNAGGVKRNRWTVVVACDHAHISGGLAKVAIESAIGLARRGHRVIYFAGVPPVEPRMVEAGVDVICLDQPDLLGDASPLRAAVRGLWNQTAAHRLSLLLRDLDPTTSLVHVHGWAKSLSPSIGRVLAGTTVPAVHTIHEYFLACPNGAFYDYQKQRNCPLRPLSLACVATHCDARSRGHKLFRVLRQAVLWGPGGMPGRLHHFICISDLQRRVIGPYLPAGATVHALANPIAVEDRGACPVERNDRFLFVGRLSAEKGAVMFAEAARRTGLKATFVGEGGEAERIRAILPDAELPGWLSPERVIATMRASRALVFPSLWYECQPLTTFEAAANGLPVIVSDNCAGREAVNDGETGLWFESGSVDALAAAMQRLADPARAAVMGRAAHAGYWSDPLTLDRHVDGLEQTYAAVFADPVPGPERPGAAIVAGARASRAAG